MTGNELVYDAVNHRSLALFTVDDSTLCGAMRCVAGAWISSTGGASAPFRLGLDPFEQSSNPSAALGANTYTLAWGSYGNNRPYVMSQVNSAADGSLVADTIQLGFEDVLSMQFYIPKVAYDSTAHKFLTVWGSAPSNNDVYGASNIIGRFTAADGSPLGSPISISEAHGLVAPKLAYNPSANQFLVSWGEYSANAWGIFAQVIDAADGSKVGQVIDVSQTAGVHNNTIINNLAYGLSLSGQAIGGLSVKQNNLFGNKTFDLSVETGTQNQTLDATQNYWGKIDPGEIGGRIHDCNDDNATSCGDVQSTLGEVLYDPALSAPVQNAPVFVSDASFDPQPVGINQTGTVKLTFSAPMDTSHPPALTFFDARRGTMEDIAGTDSGGVLARDPAGNIWIGCNDITEANCWGIKHYDGQHWVTYDTTSGLAKNRVNALYISRGGDVWAAHGEGDVLFSRMTAGVWRQYRWSDIPLSGSNPGMMPWVNAISEDNTGRLWFATNNSGIFSFDGTTWKRYTQAEVPLLTGTSGVGSVARDGQGRMWFSHNFSAMAQDMGFSVFDGTTWTSYSPGKGLPSTLTYVGLLFGDSQGRIWAGVSSPDPAHPTDYTYTDYLMMEFGGNFPLLQSA